MNFLRSFGLVWLVGLNLMACTPPPPYPGFGIPTDHSTVPLRISVFYARPDLVTYCVDHRMLFTRSRTACAKAYAHSCGVALPANGAYSKSEVYAICDSFSPRFD